MLVVLGDLDEFEAAVQRVVTTVTFDTDVVVSVFETNIRIVGGLVSAHILAELGRRIFKEYIFFLTRNSEKKTHNLIYRIM